MGPEVEDEGVKENMRLKRKAIMRGTWMKRVVYDDLSLLGWKSAGKNRLKDVECSSHEDEKNSATIQIHEESQIYPSPSTPRIPSVTRSGRILCSVLTFPLCPGINFYYLGLHYIFRSTPQSTVVFVSD